MRELRTLKTHDKNLVQFFPIEIYTSLIAEYIFFKWIPIIGTYKDTAASVEKIYSLKYHSPRKNLNGHHPDDPFIIDLIDNKRVHR